jgi:hypothetical protein
LETREPIHSGPYYQEKPDQADGSKDYYERVEKRRDRILYSLKIALWVVIALFLVSLLFESWLNSYQRPSSGSGNIRAVTRNETRPKPLKKAGLYKYFPPNLVGYHLKGRKDLEAQEFPKAEAVYEPEDMNLQLMAPITIYGQIIYVGEQSKAEEMIQDRLSEYPSDQKNIVLFNTYAVSGFKSDDKAYFTAFIYKGMVVWFRSEYIEIVPNIEDRKKILENHCKKVAEETIKYIERVEAGEGEDEPGI